jgi:glycosyltransferase involved in cell wall biosynthesis
MKIALDATPLLGRPTGVGTYVRGLVEAFAELDVDVRMVPFTLRSGTRPAGLPATATWRHLPFPARVLQSAWSRVPFPPVEIFAGRVDVFHATNFVSPPARRAGSVVTVHDLTFLHHPEWVTDAVRRYQRLVPRSLRQSGAVIVTPSHAVADEVAEAFGVPRERVVPTPLGVDASWGQAPPTDDDWLAARELPRSFVLFAGAREPRKNLAVLLGAHRAARKEGSVPDLVLAGPAGWGDQQAQHEGVHLLGWLPRPELQRLVSRARAVVLPSRYEGFGLPVLEAMAAGTEVLASDIPAHREVAGDCARLVPPLDVAAWADALQALAAPPDAQVLERARIRASEHSWLRCAQATLTAYEAATS